MDLERLDGRTVGLGMVVLAVGLVARCGRRSRRLGGAPRRSRANLRGGGVDAEGDRQAALAGLPLDAAVKAHGVGSIAAERAR